MNGTVTLGQTQRLGWQFEIFILQFSILTFAFCGQGIAN
jgi:hypothetical protein